MSSCSLGTTLLLQHAGKHIDDVGLPTYAYFGVPMDQARFTKAMAGLEQNYNRWQTECTPRLAA